MSSQKRSNNLPPRVHGALKLVSKISGKAERIIDLGCGDGKVTLVLKEGLGAKEVYGVDIDEKAILAARQKGINAYCLNLSEDKLPFHHEFFDLALSLEVVEHLINPDNMLKEVRRVLREGGVLLISTPNLASWANRLLLMLGYQPYNVEVSTEVTVGLPYRRGVFRQPAGHVRAFTLRSLKELLQHHGFRVVESLGAPGVNPKNPFFRLLDKLFSLRCSLARRLVVVAMKS